jgi:hypothetical protein
VTEEFNISYSFSLTDGEPSSKAASGTPQAASSGLVALRPVDEFHLPGGNVLLLSKYSGHRLSVTRDVSIALAYCQEFRTLAGHAEFLVSYMPELGGNTSDVMNVLSIVRDSGLLAGAEEICDQVNRPAEVSGNRAPGKVFVITCDRPAAVKRLLESVLQHADLSVCRQLFLVDDSRNAESARSNEAAVAAFNQRSPKEIVYFGAAAQRQFLSDLIGMAPHHEASIRFLLDRQRWPGFETFGIARNLCLLLSTGDRAIVLDDDVLCAAYEVPHRKPGVNFCGAASEIDFYESAAAWQQACSIADEDPLSEHLRFLGLSLPQALRELGHEKCTADMLAGAPVSQARALKGDSKILVTQSGTLGYPGTLDNSWIVSVGNETLDRLMNYRDGVKAALEVRQWWRGRGRPTFLRRPEMSQVTGLDNSVPLPPYMPVLRGEDLIFGTLLEFLFPTGLAMESARAVPHLPLEERKGRATGASATVKGGVGLLAQYLEERQVGDASVSFDTRLAALVHLFRELSEHSVDSLKALYRTELARAQANQARLLDDRFREAAGRPPEWAALLQEALAETYSDLQRERPLLHDAGEARNPDEGDAFLQLRSALGEFADSLSAWPELRHAAAKITAAGFG